MSDVVTDSFWSHSVLEVVQLLLHYNSEGTLECNEIFCRDECWPAYRSLLAHLRWSHYSLLRPKVITNGNLTGFGSGDCSLSQYRIFFLRVALRILGK